MFDIPVIGKVLGEAYKVGQHFLNKKEEAKILIITDEMRRMASVNIHSCWKPVIGSEEDRLASKMVSKGYLARVPQGYMLPEFGNREGASGSLY